MQQFVANALDSWAAAYSNHAALRTTIGFFHVGGLLLSGGIAVSADRQTLIAAQAGPAERKTQLRVLGRAHRIVLVGMAAIIFSGLLLFAADVGTFLNSIVFWIKMGLFVMLLINGLLLTRAERLAESDDLRGWSRLTATSIASIMLWFLTTLVGAALPNIG